MCATNKARFVCTLLSQMFKLQVNDRLLLLRRRHYVVLHVTGVTGTVYIAYSPVLVIYTKSVQSLVKKATSV